MHIDSIDTIRDLETLRPEWEELWKRCPDSTPFQHPDWLIPWWKVFGSGALFTFSVREHGRLIALAPMFLHSWNGRRQVTFIGTGISDYLGIISEPGAATAACEQIVTAVFEQRSRWELCDLQELSAGSPLLALKLAPPLESAVNPQCVCSSIPLARTVAEFHSALPHGLRRNLRRYRGQLAAAGEVSFETASESNHSEYLDALIALHSARWREKDATGMLSSPQLESFHRAAAWGLWRRGLVRLHALRLDGRIAAIVYALQHRQRAYSYLGGFDPAIARFSPGALIMGYTIEQAILEGIREFDFLRGSESYKSDWGAKPGVTSRLLLWHQQCPVDLLEVAIA